MQQHTQCSELTVRVAATHGRCDGISSRQTSNLAASESHKERPAASQYVQYFEAAHGHPFPLQPSRQAVTQSHTRTHNRTRRRRSRMRGRRNPALPRWGECRGFPLPALRNLQTGNDTQVRSYLGPARSDCRITCVMHASGTTSQGAVWMPVQFWCWGGSVICLGIWSGGMPKKKKAGLV